MFDLLSLEVLMRKSHTAGLFLAGMCMVLTGSLIIGFHAQRCPMRRKLTSPIRSPHRDERPKSPALCLCTDSRSGRPTLCDGFGSSPVTCTRYGASRPSECLIESQSHNLSAKFRRCRVGGSAYVGEPDGYLLGCWVSFVIVLARRSEPL